MSRTCISRLTCLALLVVQLTGTHLHVASGMHEHGHGEAHHLHVVQAAFGAHAHDDCQHADVTVNDSVSPHSLLVSLLDAAVEPASAQWFLRDAVGPCGACLPEDRPPKTGPPVAGKLRLRGPPAIA
ncbi:MAG: hypothetical protein AAGE01_06300 [Pseudomonadota bacterium]